MPADGAQTPAEQREHYEIERELAGRLRAAPSKEARRRLYGEVYRERSQRIPHHPLVRQAADPAMRRAAVRPQVALLEPLVEGSTCFAELGAGDGAVARELAPLVRRSLAFDVSDALALPSDPSVGFEFRLFDGFDLELPPDCLDVVYSNDVVEHLHPDDMLEQACAVRAALRPGGVYVCVTPNRLSGPHDISGLFSDTPEGFHLREYTATELASVFRSAGFGRVEFVFTVRGRRLTPRLPVSLLRPVEAILGRLPRALRHPLARLLAGVKVVAVN